MTTKHFTERKLIVHDLDLIDYEQAYTFQKKKVDEVLNGADSQLILCEHPPIVTCGRLTDKKNILASHEEFKKQGVVIKDIDRGGDVTLHAPGQLVAYPIIDLSKIKRDLHHYLSQLEKLGIALLSDFDIVGRKHPSKTGVWVENKKIISIGIGVTRWVSFHGIGINVNTDLDLFKLINACGLSVVTTSMKQIKGHHIDMTHVKQHIVKNFKTLFDFV